jgi:hypothetical protein
MGIVGSDLWCEERPSRWRESTYVPEQLDPVSTAQPDDVFSGRPFQTSMPTARRKADRPVAAGGSLGVGFAVTEKSGPKVLAVRPRRAARADFGG